MGNDGVLVVPDAKLALIGEHSIRVRARRIGEPSSLESEGTTLTVWVDPDAPQVDLKVVSSEQGAMLVAEGRDIGTGARDIVYAWQLDDDERGTFDATSVRALSDLGNAKRVSVYARDRAGNVSKAATVDAATVRAKAKAAAAAIPGGGCASTSADATLLGAWALLALFAATRPRRQRASRRARR